MEMWKMWKIKTFRARQREIMKDKCLLRKVLRENVGKRRRKASKRVSMLKIKRIKNIFKSEQMQNKMSQKHKSLNNSDNYSSEKHWILM